MKKAFELPTGTLTVETTKEIIPFDESIRIGARNNAKRGFLIVSTLIGRHWPTRPATMTKVMNLLADQIGPIDGPVTFVGMAETAVGIGEGISSAWQQINQQSAWTLQTTRQLVDGVEPVLTTTEDHSHAADHLLYAPHGTDCFTGHTIVIVDDECSTGKTFQNLEAQIRAKYPGVAGFRYVAIANWSSTPVTSLIEGSIEWEGKTLDTPALAAYHGFGKVKPNDGPRTGLSGTRTGIKAQVDPVREGEKILVLGDGENGYCAYLLARRLEEEGGEVYIQSITRSPVLLTGAIRTAHQFEDPLGSGAQMFAYNIDDFYDRIILVSPENNNHKSKLIDTVHCHYIEKVAA